MANLISFKKFNFLIGLLNKLLSLVNYQKSDLMFRGNEMKEYDIKAIMDLVKRHDEGQIKKVTKKPDAEDLRKKLADYFVIKDIEDKTILGIDIYQYSQYEESIQMIIPVMFQEIYRRCIYMCWNNEKYLFQKYERYEHLGEQFIDTGDGGFQLFDTPLHAIIFIAYFSTSIHLYNSYSIFPKMRELTGEISLRYVMTHDKTYKIITYDNIKRYYGPSIINNARILSKDNLNRFLIDQNTYEWFMMKINGVENLENLKYEDISKIEYFSSNQYNAEIIKNNKYSIFLRDDKNLDKSIISKFKSVDVLKIGKIKAKMDELSIYNLHIQVKTPILEKESADKKGYYVISTIGNLNTSGISD